MRNDIELPHNWCASYYCVDCNYFTADNLCWARKILLVAAFKESVFLSLKEHSSRHKKDELPRPIKEAIEKRIVEVRSLIETAAVHNASSAVDSLKYLLCVLERFLE